MYLINVKKLKILFTTGAAALLLTSCGGGSDLNLNFSKYPMTEEKEGDDTKFVYIDPSTNEKATDFEVETKYTPGPFINGYSLVAESTDDEVKYHYINTSGEKKGDEYLKASYFNNGLAPVVQEDEPVKFINTSFETVFKATQADGQPFLKVKGFKNGYAPVMSFDNKWGFINEQGKVVIEPQYEKCSQFNQGYASVVKKDSPNNLRGIINKEGKEVIELTDEYGFLGVPKEERIRFHERDDYDYGFLNLSGEEVIDNGFDYVTPFHNGRASFREDGEYGAINKEGKEVIDADYEESIIYFGNYALAKEGAEKVGIINKAGEEVIEPDYKAMFPPVFGEQFLAVEDDECFFVNTNGEQISTNEYTEPNEAALTAFSELTDNDFAINPFAQQELKTKKVDVSGEVSQILGTSKGGIIHGFKRADAPADISYIKNNEDALWQSEKNEARYRDLAQELENEFEGTLYRLVGGNLSYPYSSNPYNIILDDKLTVTNEKDTLVDIDEPNIDVKKVTLIFTDDMLKPVKTVKREYEVSAYRSLKCYMIQGGAKANEEANLDQVELELSIDTEDLPDMYDDEIIEQVKQKLEGKGLKQVDYSSYSSNLEPGTYALSYGFSELTIQVQFPEKSQAS